MARKAANVKKKMILSRDLDSEEPLKIQLQIPHHVYQPFPLL